MATNIVEVDEFTTNVVTMEDGDPRDAASVLQATQPLANRAKYLRGRVIGAATTYLYLPAMIDATLANFVWTNTWGTGGIGTSNRIAYAQNNTGTPNHIYVPLGGLPKAGAKISQVRAFFYPVTGHGSLPTQPTLSLLAQPIDGGAPSTIATRQHNAASVPAYETDEVITMVAEDSLPYTITDVETYWIKFEGESGGAAVPGLALFRLDVTVTP